MIIIMFNVKTRAAVLYLELETLSINDGNGNGDVKL